MTLDRHDENPQDDAEHGVLSDAGSVDTTSISILGSGTAQLRVDLPLGSEDDLIDDDDIIGDEIHIDEIAAGDIILEELPGGASVQPHDVHDAEEVHDEVHEQVHEHHGETSEQHHEHHGETGEQHHGETDEQHHEHHGETDEQPAESEGEPEGQASVAEVGADEADVWVEVDADEWVEVEASGEADASDETRDAVEVESSDEAHDVPGDADAAQNAREIPAAVAGPDVGVDERGATPSPAAHSDSPDPSDLPQAASNAAVPPALAPSVAETPPAPAPAVVEAPRNSAQAETTASPGVVPAAVAPAVAAAAVVTPAPATSSIPTTRREAHNTGAQQRIDRAHSVERVTTSEPELVLASKRLGEFDGGRESPDLLTADRLLDRSQLTKPEPEGLWQQLVFTLSGHRINLGDGRKARARKELDRKISAPLAGGARFVPVLSRKGGVGKTTVTALLGMALADARDDRVIAVDANPDRGTLADRISRTSARTVRDLVRSRSAVTGYSDISGLVARDETRLDVLSSDADPRVSEAFNDRDYRDVAELAAHYYSLVLTDTGTGIVHSVMQATLELADQLVIVAGLSVDEARLASETLTWLETNGYAGQVRDAIVVLNNARPGAPLVRESELETHFKTRVRTVIRVPYDTAIGAGSAIVFRDLQPATRQAARELAAAVIEGLRTGAQVG